MNRFLVIFVISSIVGCTTYSVSKSCSDGGECVRYAQVSEGEASGISAAVTGGGHTCKVTTFGDPVGWEVEYKGKKCDARLNVKDTYDAQGDES